MTRTLCLNSSEHYQGRYRKILNYLGRREPAYITELVLNLGINNNSMNKDLRILIRSGLVICDGPHSTGTLRVLAKKQTDENVKQVFRITPLGRRALETMNKMELMICGAR